MEHTYTLGSLFDGSGGFPLAGTLCGIKPVWSAEVEPYPIAVTKSRFPNMKHYGDVSKVNGAEIEPVDIITFGSPCFPAGTLVLTDNGYKPIEEIKVGDRCLTHKGHWQKVTAIGNKYAKTISLSGHHYGLVCTPNHPIYTGGETWTPAANMLGKKWSVPCAGIDTIDIPQMQHIGAKYNKPPTIDTTLMYICGRYVADGWVRNGQRPHKPAGQTWHQVFICANNEKTEKLMKYLETSFDKVALLRDRTVNKLRIVNAPFCEWISSQFGKGAANKSIPSWLYSAPVEYREAFLRGYFDGDGDKDKLRAKTVSKKLAHGIRLLGEITWSDMSGAVYFTKRSNTCVIEDRICNQKDSYTVRFYDNPKDMETKECKHWYKVKSISECGYQTVYNITVEEDHSYIAEGIVVHNCQDMSIAGKRAGLKHESKGDDETTRSGLFMEAVRIIKEMRKATNGKYPRFAIWENVTGAFSSNKGEDFRVVLEELIRIKEPSAAMPPVPRGGGTTQTVTVETDGALHTELLMRNIGESPSVAVESTLSSILQDNVPETYCLSARACQGILNRAARRGKDLPEILKKALLMQSESGGAVTEAERER